MSTPTFSRRTVLSLASCLLVVATSSAALAGPYSALYAFGDSLSDLGNTYNKILSIVGTDQNVYTDIDYTAAPNRYDNGRWSDGPVWVEHLNNSLGLSPLARNDGSMPLASGTNFAWGGSTSSTGYTDFVLANLQTQVSSYLSLASGSASANSLYSIWSGGNDVIYYIEENMPNNPTAIDHQAATMASNIGAAITTLYNAGARHFIVPNLPALGDKPSYVDTPNQAFANAIVDAYNPKLTTTLANLEAQHNDIQIFAWDVYSDFNNILQNPGNFGFSNVKDSAFIYQNQPYPGVVVANPNTYVFWDQTHPTAPGHALLGQYAHAVVVPEPATILLLGIAFALPLARRRQKYSPVSGTTGRSSLPISRTDNLCRT